MEKEFLFTLKDLFFIIEPIFIILAAWFHMDKRISILDERIEKSMQGASSIKEEFNTMKHQHERDIRELRQVLRSEIENLTEVIVTRIDRIYEILITR